MKLLRKVTLHFREGNSDKVYEVDLCEHSNDRPQRYVVNFRYGRRGGSLREGTKTVTPVDLTEAEEIFASLIVNKENKGYRRSDTPTQTITTPSLPPEADQAQWHQRLLALLDNTDRDRRHRAIWRVGEIGLIAAQNKLLLLATQGDIPQIYCAVWALGRLQQEASLPLLQQLSQHTDERIRRIASEALITCLPLPARQQHLQTLLTALPASLQALCDQQDSDIWVHAITQALGVAGEHAYLLETLYRLAVANPSLHQALCNIVASFPLQPPYFRVFRHLFKHAEFRLDTQMLGAISKRLETTSPSIIGRWFTHPHTRKLTSVADELKKPDSVVAYSAATRNYLRRRVWRMCRRLGEIDDDRYIALASAILNAVSDADANAPTTRERYEWKRVDGRYRRVLTATKHYPAYAGYLAFNHILFDNSQQFRLSTSGRAWEFDATQPEPHRAEAFPELWDRHPQALLQLLQTNRNTRVHHFAVQALGDNPDFCAHITTDDLCQLLVSGYRETALFALNLAQPRINTANPDWQLLASMLDAPTLEVRQSALHWLRTTTVEPTSANLPRVWAHLICNVDTEVRTWALKQLPWLARLELLPLLPLIEQRLPSLTENAFSDALMRDVICLLCEKLQPASAQLTLEWPHRWLFAEAKSLQQLGAELLVVNHIPLAQIPSDMLARINNADNAAVRALGIRLLQKLSADELITQAEALITAMLSPHADIRQAAIPLTTQLIRQNEGFAQQCLQNLMAALFQSEPAEGLHDAILVFIQQTLSVPAQQLDSGTVWRLLQARSRGAQRLGEWLLPIRNEKMPLHNETLPQRNATHWSIRQWATLGSHPSVAVREWVQQMYNDHIERIRADKSNALRLLNSPWPDTQNFALTFFRTRFEAADWTPTLLIFLVDHVEETIQRFGRELITQFFDAGAGPEYLAKLSQHPSTQVQLFASNFLQDHAGHQPERILGLQHYFLTVLSQVNRGRVAKDRVLQFLAQEAQQDQQVAALTLQLLTRLSATAARQDKAAFLTVLLALNKRYPDLPTPFTVNEHPVKPIRGMDTSHTASPGTEDRHAV